MNALAKASAVTAILMGASLTSPTALAQTPDILAKIYDCKSVTDSAERLACYDQSVGRLEAAEKAGDVVTIDREAAEQIQRDSFGFSIPSLPKLGLFRSDGKKGDKPDFETVSLPIKSMNIRGSNRFARFTFDNGQVWIQTQKTRKLKMKEGDVLVIRKAALGSFLGRINDTGPQIRIRREK